MNAREEALIGSKREQGQIAPAIGLAAMGVKPGVANGADSCYLNLAKQDAAPLKLADVRLPKIEMALPDGKAAFFKGLGEFN